ncbi:Magnesium and cobalt efflux protein CorC [Candidatus Paraburkholderia kirkii]|nr:Magnesium and cobalt efflux protein CorC [Candidatus Paraburkholderia kirkii]
MTVSDLIRPAHELVGLRNDLPMRENLAVIARHRFSRYPLFADASGERVIGMIHLKDLLLAGDGGGRGFNFSFSKEAGKVELSRHVRPVQYVAPNLSALELFRRFRKGAPHLAIVGRKGAKPIGFITLDNLLGALVGQIHDEFRQGDADWSRMDDGTLMGKGSLPVGVAGAGVGHRYRRRTRRVGRGTRHQCTRGFAHRGATGRVRSVRYRRQEDERAVDCFGAGLPEGRGA